MPGVSGPTDGILVIAGRRALLHRVRMQRGLMVAGDSRCNLDWEDEEWAPRKAEDWEIDNVEKDRLCGWCFPRKEGV
jgi:hypothetical protein